MNKMIDLTNKKYSSLTVLKFSHINKHNQSCWFTYCICGNKNIIVGASLRNRLTKSCGCLRNKNKIKHNMSHSLTHNTWTSMRQRCRDKNNKYYGKRKIKVCKRWLIFKNFYEDMGKRPKGLTLERMNNNKGYCKDNCKWATLKEQANNRRNNIKRNTNEIL